ncbi:hypothetical protein CONPUDRAFT_70765 [Coniophora puteana RWD-64-598 SS2]|uniref:Uncharacterized protein n=1 Tax=Coniophora puteana (strain RWD-64-598) TaxID=741705 RepID=A0A5M3MXL2_CONPW|nr:uncharacterized protein CONPUDRAFT_70765 [Coniophora puteana RWD-64-598 SS2]EIW83830.1 hypothetical protein CONPUDRAFT_70765 [Coniophora puteana RWD-64-598 SS2]
MSREGSIVPNWPAAEGGCFVTRITDISLPGEVNQKSEVVLGEPYFLNERQRTFRTDGYHAQEIINLLCFRLTVAVRTYWDKRAGQGIRFMSKWSNEVLWLAKVLVTFDNFGIAIEPPPILKYALGPGVDPTAARMDAQEWDECRLWSSNVGLWPAMVNMPNHWWNNLAGPDNSPDITASLPPSPPSPTPSVQDQFRGHFQFQASTLRWEIPPAHSSHQSEYDGPRENHQAFPRPTNHPPVRRPMVNAEAGPSRLVGNAEAGPSRNQRQYGGSRTRSSPYWSRDLLDLEAEEDPDIIDVSPNPYRHQQVIDLTLDRQSDVEAVPDDQVHKYLHTDYSVTYKLKVFRPRRNPRRAVAQRTRPAPIVLDPPADPTWEVGSAATTPSDSDFDEEFDRLEGGALVELFDLIIEEMEETVENAASAIQRAEWFQRG